MKISGPGQIKGASVSKAKAKSRTTGSSFSGSVQIEEAGEAANASGASPIASVDALLSLQEVPDSTDGRSKGFQQADQMLNHLEGIRRGLLLGMIPKARLQNLSAMIKKRRDQFSDPQLTEIMDQIELRARVELAKLDAHL